MLHGNRNNKMITPDDAAKGEEGIVCDECGGALMVRKGDINIHHFAHIATDKTGCSYSERNNQETEAHKHAIKKIAEQCESLGWIATREVQTPDKARRADLMVARNESSNLWAIEVQNSIIKQSKWRERTASYLEQGYDILWVLTGDKWDPRSAWVQDLSTEHFGGVYCFRNDQIEWVDLYDRFRGKNLPTTIGNLYKQDNKWIHSEAYNAYLSRMRKIAEEAERERRYRLAIENQNRLSREKEQRRLQAADDVKRLEKVAESIKNNTFQIDTSIEEYNRKVRCLELSDSISNYISRAYNLHAPWLTDIVNKKCGNTAYKHVNRTLFFKYVDDEILKAQEEEKNLTTFSQEEALLKHKKEMEAQAIFNQQQIDEWEQQQRLKEAERAERQHLQEEQRRNASQYKNEQVRLTLIAEQEQIISREKQRLRQHRQTTETRKKLAEFIKWLDRPDQPPVYVPAYPGGPRNLRITSSSSSDALPENYLDTKELEVILGKISRARAKINEIEASTKGGV